MKTLRYEDDAKNILEVGGKQVHGGETFRCSNSMAEELLTAPYVDVTLIEDHDASSKKSRAAKRSTRASESTTQPERDKESS